ncbi:MAG: transposase [Rhizobiales bacterium]|nr:transposase [Hyphomicrobiales bacterium]
MDMRTARRASGSMRFLASVLPWPPPWSPASLTPKAFRSGRGFSAWIGLVPRQNSSGGKGRLGSIGKQGDRYLRSLFTNGALAVIRYAKIHGTKQRPWLTALLAAAPTKVAAIALANKIARMASAIIAFEPHPSDPTDLGRVILLR